ncbi:MAG: ATP synthase F1 subunit delta [Halanaerobiales bacterium]
MINNEAALRYSSALFEMGREKETLISFQEDLNKVRDLIKDNQDFEHAFYHKEILVEDKKAIVRQIFEKEISSDVLNFIQLLIDNRREEHIKDIVKNFNILVNKEEAIVEIEVITAVNLGEELRQELLDKLNQLLDYKIVLHPVVDPDIIGGIILKFNDFIVDGSIKNSLKKLQDNIKNVPVSM